MKVRFAKTITFSTDDSVVGISITWPEPLSRDELSELKEFVAIWLRQLERHADVWPDVFCEHGLNKSATCPSCEDIAADNQT